MGRKPTKKKDRKITFNLETTKTADGNTQDDTVMINPGAEDGDEPGQEQNGDINTAERTRSISTVSMGSNDGGDSDNILRKGSTKKSLKLHQVILLGNQEELEKVLSKTTDLNARDISGKTALHTAILCKQVRSVEMLLEAGADVLVADDSGDTPMHTAIRVGSQKIVEILLRHDGDPNMMGRSGCTPLHLAASTDSVGICKLLVQNNGHIDQEDEERMTPIGHAIERGAVKCAEYLLNVVKERQEDMEKMLVNVDADGSTLLHLAVNSGVLKGVQLCIAFGSRIRQPKIRDKKTAFHMACDQGFLEIVQFMHSKDPAICRITMVDKAGVTPIHVAAQGNHVKVVEFLIEKGAKVDPPSHDRHTPLFLAAQHGATETVKLLIENGADVMVRDVNLKSVLHAAVGFPSTMESLLQSPAAVALITEKDLNGFSPVHYAAKRGDFKNAALFVSKNKAAASVASDSLDTPIHVAAKYGKAETVEKLMDKQNAKIINLQNNKGRTALHFACTEGQDQVADFLLTQGAIIEKDQADQTPLHLAALKGSRKCCECIIERSSACINVQDSQNKNTALHLAATNGHASVVTYLLSVPEQEILMNNSNQNILDIAVTLEKKNVVIAIAKHQRWREVLTTCAIGTNAQLQEMVKKMPDVLQLYLDNCVTESGDPATKEYSLRYDLGLIQGPTGPDSMVLLKRMAEYHRDSCLTHPLCFLLLDLNWKNFGWCMLVLGFLTNLVYVVPLTALAIYTRMHEEDLCGFNSSVLEEDLDIKCTRNSTAVQAMNVIVLTITLVLLILEIIQIFKKRFDYLMEMSNYVQMISFITAIIYVITFCDCKSGGMREVGAVSLFFGWVNLILFLRQMASYGVYVIMLVTMFVTLIKVLLIWILFIIAFGVTFYLLVGKEKADNLAAFGDFPLSMMAMFVMTLGELNYHDTFLPWEELRFPTLTNIMFILLVLGMPIIMMNMLVGLAVGDIGAIQKNAAIDRYILQVQLLIEIMESLPMWIHRRVRIGHYIVFPNHSTGFISKVKEAMIGFSAASTEEQEQEEDAVVPALEQLTKRVEDQDSRLDVVVDLLKQQAQMLQEIKRMEKAAVEAKESTSMFQAPKWPIAF